ncbi:MAG: exosortase C-terminal domain/associated protein EpsI [Sphingobium sp.]
MMRRRDMLGAGCFAALSCTVSAATIGWREMQHVVGADTDEPLTRLPPRIGQWRLQAAREDMVDPVEIDIAFAQAMELYDRVVERDYVAETLPRIMLNIAYKRTVSQEDRFHWPELCYSTQGFDIDRLTPVALGAVAPGATMSRFVGDRAGRRELVGYIMRIGDSMPVNSVALRSSLFRQSFGRERPDGVLWRMSFIIGESGTDDLDVATAMLSDFFVRFIKASAPPLRALLVRQS